MSIFYPRIALRKAILSLARQNLALRRMGHFLSKPESVEAGGLFPSPRVVAHPL